ncbi:hypothetical protein BACCOPRO_00281 [Phocaeicola coprophilus DSM 18228 = JCM 13818]|uniref:Uncharacterized protein n=1 Tax=Phocaeicola coprophilus DSM 18228 = JCM 13818 TaxID=547042 RepID=S0F8D8_9BACT|nr:hypothetical protein BACCOPRO_00281 [Phocaeicola coprophilus DSM 18228 = JCM 13818]
MSGQRDHNERSFRRNRKDNSSELCGRSDSIVLMKLLFHAGGTFVST